MKYERKCLPDPGEVNLYKTAAKHNKTNKDLPGCLKSDSLYRKSN